MKAKRQFRILAVFLIGAPMVGRGDVVFTADGSKLVGKIEKIADGKVIIVTDVAGKLEIDAAKVTSIATDEPMNVELKSGDKLIGVVQAAPESTQSVVKSSVGDVSVPQGDMVSVWKVGAESPAEEKVKAKYRPQWTTILEAGANATEGNTDTLNARGRFEVNRRTGFDFLKFYATADYGEQNDERNRNEYRVGSLYEYNFTERFYAYLRGELEYDEFENLDLRATVAGGVGYYWIKKAEHELKTRAGAGYRHETYGSGRTEDEPIADLGLDYRLDVSKWMQFTHSTTYTPSLERFRDYRLDLDTALLFPLKYEQWKLKLGMRNAYNSNPSGDLDRLDNLYYASVLMEIKR